MQYQWTQFDAHPVEFSNAQGKNSVRAVSVESVWRSPSGVQQRSRKEQCSCSISGISLTLTQWSSATLKERTVLVQYQWNQSDDHPVEFSSAQGKSSGRTDWKQELQSSLANNCLTPRLIAFGYSLQCVSQEPGRSDLKWAQPCAHTGWRWSHTHQRTPPGVSNWICMSCQLHRGHLLPKHIGSSRIPRKQPHTQEATKYTGSSHPPRKQPNTQEATRHQYPKVA